MARCPYLDLLFLLHDFIYVTVSQNSQGIEGISYCPIPIPENVLVLSSGGKGHIPILLWLMEFKPFQCAIANEYIYDVVFMGSMRTYWIRKLLIRLMLSRLRERAYASVGTNWTTIYNQRMLQAKADWRTNPLQIPCGQSLFFDFVT
jgi:hypothetical protein